MSSFQQIISNFNNSIYEYKENISARNMILKQKLERAARFLHYYKQKIGNTIEKIENLLDDINIIFEVFIFFDDFTNTTHYSYEPVKDLVEKLEDLEQEAQKLLEWINSENGNIKLRFDRFISFVKEKDTKSLSQKYVRGGLEFWAKKCFELSSKSSIFDTHLNEIKEDMENILV